ncbi:hypothetical protein GMES_1697 [Paraglaciecola mesophila KMM 241]|uniref:Uncharacterized protein n=1 Tax=Paraglaciecola mesophila KMM 241 TaxID=1128912 RepID=K6Z4R1_9ALTE|nr:hypothetical protein GMES_1697 [Paraglaciecola mesophila KMM 241]
MAITLLCYTFASNGSKYSNRRYLGHKNELACSLRNPTATANFRIAKMIVV